MPMSAATLTTSRLVDVPMVVAMPPMMLAKPIGISVPDGETPERIETPINMGSINTTMGVLLMKALSVAVIRMVNNKETAGDLRHSLPRKRPTGSSAPVRIRPCPTSISPQTATRALWPNPRKKSLACSTLPSASNGNSVKPTVMTTSTTRLVVCSGMVSRVNRTRAPMINIITASACVLGSASSSIFIPAILSQSIYFGPVPS